MARGVTANDCTDCQDSQLWPSSSVCCICQIRRWELKTVNRLICCALTSPSHEFCSLGRAEDNKLIFASSKSSGQLVVWSNKWNEVARQSCCSHWEHAVTQRFHRSELKPLVSSPRTKENCSIPPAATQMLSLRVILMWHPDVLVKQNEEFVAVLQWG